MKLSGKISIVTGSSRGIGKEIAKQFAKEGSFVVVLSRSKKNIEETVKEIKEAGGNAMSIQTDISNNFQVKSLVKEVIKKRAKIDILVNSAAHLKPIGPISEIDTDEWVNSVKTNLFGTFYFIKNVVPYMIKQRSGKIINLAGGGAFNPFPNFSAYSSSKAAIVRLTETLSKELKKYNIFINGISPGAIKTKMTEEVIEYGKMSGDEYAKAMQVMSTGGANIDNVLKLAIFLASNDSDGLSGKTISAQWDDLNFIKQNINKIQDSDKFTMKRIT